mmetsp:Transcript_25321/g.68800  ORF Transcript_25321/g.68800 Transcript_25321/m.68800 type:complete len:267 (+) Transcript_25321:1238-2038(+)
MHHWAGRIRHLVHAALEHRPPFHCQLHEAEHKGEMRAPSRQHALQRALLDHLEYCRGQEVHCAGVTEDDARLAQHTVRLHHSAAACAVACAFLLIQHGRNSALVALFFALPRELTLALLDALALLLSLGHIVEKLHQLLQMLVCQLAIHDACVQGPRQLMACVACRHCAVIVMQGHEQLRTQRAVAQLLEAHIQALCIPVFGDAQLHNLVVDFLGCAHHTLQHLQHAAALAQDLAGDACHRRWAGLRCPPTASTPPCCCARSRCWC